jgi:ABC-type multidrug transport system fused ATPase/permease subunit
LAGHVPAASQRQLEDGVTSFVSFDDVWLAYNDELLAPQQFAVEAITLRAEPGEFIAIVGRRAAASRPS